MLRVHINFENGDSFTTRFNGTPEEAAHFYKLDRLFNIGIVEDNIQPIKSLMIEKAWKNAGNPGVFLLASSHRNETEGSQQSKMSWIKPIKQPFSCLLYTSCARFRSGGANRQAGGSGAHQRWLRREFWRSIRVNDHDQFLCDRHRRCQYWQRVRRRVSCRANQ